MDRSTLRKIAAGLLDWFAIHKRSLPWRETKDSYKIWVSEVMLQQTQVNTVIPYYERWMKIFPNVRALAAASLPKVLKAWEGLGYYPRARNLHQTAKLLVKKWGGKFPDSRSGLEELPGIGPYTAGAVASIAFGKPEPILDGNVTRVLSRVFALKAPVDQGPGKKKLWTIAKTLVEGVHPLTPTLSPSGGEGLKVRGLKNPYGDLNQSLMELGALVCFPESPKCFACPLKKICQAHRLKREMEFPVRAQREKTEKLKTLAAVIWKKRRVLLAEQPLGKRWGGLWIFPQWIPANGKAERSFLARKLKEDLGIRAGKLKPQMELEHGFTKYRVRLQVYEGKTRSTLPLPPMTRWVELKKLSHLPLPSPHQKIAQWVQAHA